MVTNVNQEKNTKEEGNGNKQKPKKHEEKGDDSRCEPNRMMAKGLNFEHGIKTNFFSTSSLVLSVGSTEKLGLSLVTHSFLYWNQNLKANSPTWFSNPTLTLLQVLN